MTDRIGTPIYSQEVPYRNKARDSHRDNAVFPTPLPGKVEGHFFSDLKPMFIFFHILGLLPFKIKNTGDVEFKFFCPLMLYSMLVQGGMAIGSGFICKQRIDHIGRENPNFGRLIVEATFIGAFIPIFLLPLVQISEATKKAYYIGCWCKFQTHYRTVVGKELDLKLRRLVTILITLKILICVLVTSFPFVSLKEFEPWFAVPFFYCVCASTMCTGLWYVNGRAVTISVRTMMRDFEEHLLLHDFKCEDKIADYRMLWLGMSKLTQDKGTSMGFTYGVQVIGYFVELLLAVYGLLSNLKEGFVTSNFIFVASAIIFFWLIFVTCNIAQSATEEVGIKAQETLQKLFYKFPRQCTESRLEMRLFLEAIMENPPSVNFAGFVVVNRGLLTSLTSAMVTYLVVLTQFQMSTKPQANTNTTCNNSDSQIT